MIMKKLIAMLLALTMVMSLVACGATKNEEPQPATEATVEVTEEVIEATEEVIEDEFVEEEFVEEETFELTAMETLLNQIIELNPVEFFGGCMPVDLSDADAVYYELGLNSAESIAEAAVFGPMMSSMAFSLVAAQVVEGADAEAVAEEIKNGVDPRKWVCVEADEVMTAVSGDVVMLIMLNSESGLTAQSFVDAFKTVRGE